MDRRDFHQLCIEAQDADMAFGSACVEAGYKSRWNWDQKTDRNPVLIAAYEAKLAADAKVHAAFEAQRQM